MADNNVLSKPGPTAWVELWHVWFVIIPRRTITGRLAYGKVWRRWNGRRWIYKQMTEWPDLCGE